MGHDQLARYGSPWSREELILAFDLYCRIPFRMTTTKNPEVVKLAKLLGRSPGSVARKLGNFGSFDPDLQKRHITGLVHSSRMDAEIWQEFSSDWNKLVLEARRLRETLQHPGAQEAEDGVDFKLPKGESEREALRKTRVHQAFFREAVLSSYEETCCITGLRIRECLVASHIIPWSVSEPHRTDPRNGLCLSATFDRLFECGLLTISEDLHVIISRHLKESDDRRTMDLISVYHGSPLIRPRRFLPDQVYLSWHHETKFRG